jgi:hypothetical protein
MSQARKPIVYLLVNAPILVGGCLAIVALEIAGFANNRNIPRSAIPFANGMLITLPTLFLWIPISLIFSNLILRAVPALRLIAQGYVTRSGHPGFKDSRRQLLRVAVWTAVVSVPLIALGFIL